MGCENIPLQVILHNDASGALLPLRFRYEDANHTVHTMQIDQVIDAHESHASDCEIILYLCKVVQKGKESLFQLKYNAQVRQWTLFRQIY